MNWKNLIIVFTLIALISSGLAFSLQFYSEDINEYKDDANDYYSNLVGENDGDNIEKQQEEKKKQLNSIPMSDVNQSGFRSTVEVEKRSGSTINDGAGFVTTDGYIITAAHVVKNGNNIEVKYADGSTGEATLIGEDYVSDIAILEPKMNPPVDGVPLKESKIITGNQAVLIGNPGGEGKEMTEGEILKTGELIEYNGIPAPEHFTIEASIRQGYSGGPVLNQEGEIIGILRGKGDSKAFGVSSRMILEVKETVLKEGEYKHKKPLMEFSKVDITRSGSIIEKGLVATSTSNEETEIKIFKKGDDSTEADIIIGVEGDNIQDRNSLYYNILKHTSNNDYVVTVNVQRGDIETIEQLELKDVNP